MEAPRTEKPEGAKIPLTRINLRELPPGYSRDQVLSVPIRIQLRSQAPDLSEERRQLYKRLREDEEPESNATVAKKSSVKGEASATKAKSPEQILSLQEQGASTTPAPPPPPKAPASSAASSGSATAAGALASSKVLATSASPAVPAPVEKDASHIPAVRIAPAPRREPFPEALPPCEGQWGGDAEAEGAGAHCSQLLIGDVLAALGAPMSSLEGALDAPDSRPPF
ncbi:unnamed protein product [Prorocentrum cordatum]|uniref:Centrosomal protein of 19 kDa n=1 Tax=Prorocentrum cordatum TaxID=2364126 RepID=A0ABN9VS60_9DINO|nr:unnamed protein product [Polarella glacialis]